MAFKRGDPKPAGSGRKKGTPNKKDTEIAVFCRSILQDEAYQADLKRRARAGKLGPLEPLLYHYAFGKPKDTLAVERLPPILVIDELDSDA